MMSASNKTPWHGKGVVVEECKTVEECIALAGMDFTVSKRTIYLDGDTVPPVDNTEPAEAETPDDGGEVVSIPSHFAMHRDDKPSGSGVLGVVKQDYTPLQNRDAFAGFNQFVEKGEITFETAGVLDEGKQVWILARFTEERSIIGDDIVRQYLLLANGHDGVNAVMMGFCAGRVVCWNTLTAALSEHKNWIKIAHRKNVEWAVKKAGDILGQGRDYFMAAAEVFTAMTEIKMTDAQAEGFQRSVYDRPAMTGPVWQAKEKLTNLWTDGTGMDLPGVRGTLWAAYNAVTEYEDHVKQLREGTCTFKRAWMTDGARMKARAFTTAEAILGGKIKVEDLPGLNASN